jgi:hypothetical protein
MYQIKKDLYTIIVSEKSDGSMNINPDGSLANNALKLLRSLGLSNNFAYMRQTHGTDVNCINKTGLHLCDGIVSKNNLVLGVRSADCIPLMLSANRYIGAVHVSRKNLLGGIISNLSEKLISHGVNLSDVQIFLGSHIRVDSYEIKSDVCELIEKTRFSKYLLRKNKQSYFDLTAAVIGELARVGIRVHNVNDCMIDTYKQSNLFSYRRDCFLSNRIETFFTIIRSNATKKN